MSSVASTFIASVVDHDAASTPDDRTLIIKYAGGSATINFGSSTMMRDVALSILDVVPPSELYPRLRTAVWNNNAHGSERLLLTQSLVEAEPADDDDEGTVVEAEPVDEEEEASEDDETDDDPPTPRNEDPESSFESYDGHGLTQETLF